MNFAFFSERKIYLPALGLILYLVLIFALGAPGSFPSDSIFTVKDGTGLYTLSLELKEEKVIRSPFWFRAFAIALGGERAMKAGEYFFPRPENSFSVAWRMLHGRHGIEVVKTTIPEGFTVKEIAELLDNEHFSLFKRSDFEALSKEGYLFPDTYFIPVTMTATSAVAMLENNFSRKISSLEPAIKLSGRSVEEIVIMASILEGEVKDAGDLEIVSGILWKRYDRGLPLQVDASFAYINGKTSKELTLEDLKTDSPFNTYLHKGLPPTPISNPGLASLQAAIFPASTPYLYFLTGDDSKMYYSRTFEEHVAKKLQYIKR